MASKLLAEEADPDWRLDVCFNSIEVTQFKERSLSKTQYLFLSVRIIPSLNEMDQIFCDYLCAVMKTVLLREMLFKLDMQIKKQTI